MRGFDQKWKSRKWKNVCAAFLLLCVLTACDSPEEKHAKYIARGNALFEKGDYKRARLEYKNAARIKPADAEVRYRLGIVDEVEGSLQNAFGNYVAAEQQDAQYVPALNKLAQYFLVAEQLEESRKRIAVVLEKDPKNAEAHALKAGLYARENKPDAAEEEARLALEMDPRSATAYSVLTGLYANQGKQKEAQDLIERGVAQLPQNVSLLLLKAMVYDKGGNFDKIVEAYRAIFAIKPKDIQYRTDLAKIYIKADKKDQAEAFLRESIENLPESWDMKRQYVSFLNEYRGLDAAEKTVQAYMAENPDQEDLYFWLADLYMRNKNADRAIALLEKIVADKKVDPRETLGLNARTSLAQLQILKGNRALAEMLVKTVVDNNPSNQAALLIQAKLAFEKGFYQDSVALLRTIVRDNPQAIEALELLSEALLAQGFVDLAIDTLGQVVEKEPGKIAAKVRLAQLFMVQGNATRALELIRIVTKSDPSYPVGWESAARIALGAQQFDEAEKAVGSLEKFPAYVSSASYLRGQIAAKKGDDRAAMAAYKNVIAINPAAPIVQHALPALVEAFHRLKDPNGAILYLSSLPADLSLVQTFLGQVYASQNQMEKAAQAFDRAIELQPTSQTPFIGRAHLYVVGGKKEEAIRLLDRALEIAPSDQRAAMMRADILVMLKRNKDALAQYEAILARNEKALAAANNMAQLIADEMADDADLMQKARYAAERFVNSEDPSLLDTLGWVYYRAGLLSQAQTVFERIIASGKPVPLAFHYHYGRVFYDQGQKDLARAQFEKALSGKAPYAGRDEAQRLLQSLGESAPN